MASVDSLLICAKGELILMNNWNDSEFILLFTKATQKLVTNLGTPTIFKQVLEPARSFKLIISSTCLPESNLSWIKCPLSLSRPSECAVAKTWKAILLGNVVCRAMAGIWSIPNMPGTHSHKTIEGGGTFETKNKEQPRVKIIIRLLLIRENPPNADCF